MRLVKNHIKLGKLALLALVLCLGAGNAWGATYYVRSTGTAANKGAASGPCTTLANCMSKAVYADESFSEGDVIVHCHTIVDDIFDGIFDESFLDISKTISMPAAPASYVLLVDGSSKFLLINATDKLIRP